VTQKINATFLVHSRGQINKFSIYIENSFCNSITLNFIGKITLIRLYVNNFEFCFKKINKRPSSTRIADFPFKQAGTDRQ